MEGRARWIILTITGVVVVCAIVIAIAVPLSKRSDDGIANDEAPTDKPLSTQPPTTEPLTEEEIIRQKALNLMKETPLIDGHNDLPWFLKNNHDNRLEEIDLSIDISNMYEITHTDIPRLRAGRVGAQFWAAYTSCNSQYKDAVTHVLDQIDVIKRMCAKYPDDFQFVTSADGIEEAFAAGKIGGLIGVEGGHNIDSFPSVLRMLVELGMRYMTMTHSCDTPWADNWRTDLQEDPDPDRFGGLSDWGKKLIKEMNRIGVFIDLSHVNKATMIDALQETAAPVIFSHSSAFAVCPSYRNVQDDVLPLVAANRGVIMVNFYTVYINCNETYGSQQAELSQVVDHIEYLAENCGYDYVGIGGDYDGVDYVPNGLEDVSKYPDLIAALIQRGWSDENIRKLLGQNLLRAMREMEDVRDSMAEVLPLEENMPRDDGLEGSNECRTYYYP